MPTSIHITREIIAILWLVGLIGVLTAFYIRHVWKHFRWKGLGLMVVMFITGWAMRTVINIPGGP